LAFPPGRLSYPKKYRHNETFDDIVSTCSTHLRSFATCKLERRNSLHNCITQSDRRRPVFTNYVRLTFLLSCGRSQSLPSQLPAVPVRLGMTACCWPLTCSIAQSSSCCRHTYESDNPAAMNRSKWQKLKALQNSRPNCCQSVRQNITNLHTLTSVS